MASRQPAFSERNFIAYKFISIGPHLVRNSDICRILHAGGRVLGEHASGSERRNTVIRTILHALDHLSHANNLATGIFMDDYNLAVAISHVRDLLAYAAAQCRGTVEERSTTVHRLSHLAEAWAALYRDRLSPPEDTPEAALQNLRNRITDAQRAVNAISQRLPLKTLVEAASYTLPGTDDYHGWQVTHFALPIKLKLPPQLPSFPKWRTIPVANFNLSRSIKLEDLYPRPVQSVAAQPRRLSVGLVGAGRVKNPWGHHQAH